MSYAFVLTHFGNKEKYLELELYFLPMLERNTNHDIIYLYSVTDTPPSFLKAIKKISKKVKCVPYDDTNITYNISYESVYEHFNTLRTCNFIFAYTLTQYDKVCCVESDMVIMENLDGVFSLPAPSAHKNMLSDKANESYKTSLDLKKPYKYPNTINGGVILLEPSLSSFRKYVDDIPYIVEKNFAYPNEALFAYTNKVFFNLPIEYNMSQYMVAAKDINPVYIYHFDGNPFKPLHIIQDGYLEQIEANPKKSKIAKVVRFFKETYYDEYKKKINRILKALPHSP